jgi:hypothetical protein
MPRRTRRLRGGVRTEKTAKQTYLNRIKRRSISKRSRPIFKNSRKEWRNPLRRDEILQRPNDYLRKIIRLLRAIERSAEESVNDNEKYELHSFIASTLKDRTSEVFEKNHIVVPLIDKDSDDPFDYIQDLIVFIKDIIEKTSNKNKNNPLLMPVSSRGLADALEEMEQLVNADIEADQQRRTHNNDNNSSNNSEDNSEDNSENDLLELFTRLKV